ncbi:hypothetical protein CLPUN_23840 [Clostridium puniceum]|uniref:Polymer-forming cytoskeletal n=1 Tax=Clostridium puniceum TaxID=29367 RepID=A0A1S8THK3_9CLOT|nr:polymer-forming cytoskeletal protein [Clostridium puniceum]OOM77267.1 hypothetical protein CLPUN_23840 [Clostridium puniceum]
MQDAKIDGMGTIYGGEYKDVSIGGMGKLKGNIEAEKVIINGMFKSNGEIIANEFVCDGLGRILKNVKVKKAKISGVLKIRRAKLEADNITCDGVITCTHEVSADEIYIDGVCSISKMYGDKITIRNKNDGLTNSKIPTKFLMLTNIYLGRKLSLSHSLVDVIECTDLEASGLKAKIVKAQNVRLSNDCIIENLECAGQTIIDDTCKIGNIPNKQIEGADNMANASIIKILELYKSGKINVEEAEEMISIASNRSFKTENGAEVPSVGWADDGKIRIVAFRGTKLLKKSEAGTYNLSVEYKGEALNVECYGNLKCGDVLNNVDAGASVECYDIHGNVNSGHSVNCKDIGGNVDAGHSVTCGDIEGSVKCGSSINCKHISGSIDAGGKVNIS